MSDRIIARMTLTPQDRVYLAHSETVTVDITDHPELVRLRARVEAVEAERDEARREVDRLRAIIDAREALDNRGTEWCPVCESRPVSCWSTGRKVCGQCAAR